MCNEQVASFRILDALQDRAMVYLRCELQWNKRHQ